MATMKGIPVIPHNFKTGVLMSASLQILAAMPKALYLEYCCQETILSKKMIKKQYKIDSDGFVAIPQGPGMGFEIDEDIIKKYAVKL